ERRKAIEDPNFVPRKPLTVKVSAAWLGYSASMVYQLFHAGEIEGYKGPGGIRLYADSVEDFKIRYANRLREGPPVTPVEAPRRPPKRSRTAHAFHPLKHLH